MNEYLCSFLNFAIEYQSKNKYFVVSLRHTSKRYQYKIRRPLTMAMSFDSKYRMLVSAGCERCPEPTSSQLWHVPCSTYHQPCFVIYGPYSSAMFQFSQQLVTAEEEGHRMPLRCIPFWGSIFYFIFWWSTGSPSRRKKTLHLHVSYFKQIIRYSLFSRRIKLNWAYEIVHNKNMRHIHFFYPTLWWYKNALQLQIGYPDSRFQSRHV